jgi:hypothetical protein
VLSNRPEVAPRQIASVASLISVPTRQPADARLHGVQCTDAFPWLPRVRSDTRFGKASRFLDAGPRYQASRSCLGDVALSPAVTDRSLEDLTAADPSSVASESTTEDLIEKCYEYGWTDGLPVVPPTAELVARMIAASGGVGSDVVAQLGPARVPATVEKIAANAVMAGCLPVYFPVVLAAAQAVAANSTGVTIHSATPLLIVNGPIRVEIGLNSGGNALGAGHRANATIGRALQLVLRNIGGFHTGGLDAATLGHPGGYSYCVAENEESSPWPALHVDRGYTRTESTCTVYLADAPLCLAHKGEPAGEAVLSTIADALPIAGTYNMYYQRELFVVMSPEHAALIAADGFSKSAAKEYLFAHGRKPASGLLGKGMFGLGPKAGPEWMRQADLDPGTRIPIVLYPERVTIIVAGREIGGYSALIFGLGDSITVPIRRTTTWNAA